MRLLIRLLPLVATVTAVLGCGGGDKRATVSGKVTVGGKEPLTGGNIRFVSVADPSKVGGGQIKPDGTYEVPDAPVGECKVVIDNAHLDPSAKKSSGMPMVPGKGGRPSEPSAADKAKVGAPPKGADIPSEMGTKSEASGQKYTKIDPALAKAESTSLTFEVKSGSNNKDFDVK